MKKVLLTLAALLVIGGGVGYVAVEQNQPQPQAVQEVKQEPKKDEISYQGVEGKDALTLLKQKHKVTTETFSGTGEFVKSIDGVTPTKDQFWGFYINGKTATVGADSYKTKDSDVITWKLVNIE